MNPSQVGEFIKNLRKKNNLTQKDFALKLGVTYQAVSKWETGKNMPDIVLLKEISKIFDVDIEELLDGKEKEKKNENRRKNNYIVIIIVIWVIIIAIIIGFIYHKEHTTFEFKTMSSSCEDFTLTGSAAYNKDKTSIYISDVDYCGQENDTIFQNIECTLYEDYNDIKKKIGTCGKNNKEITLNEFLDTVQLNVNNYIASCKMFTSSTLYLEIQATDKENKKITYQVPIRLEENCSK